MLKLERAVQKTRSLDNFWSGEDECADAREVVIFSNETTNAATEKINWVAKSGPVKSFRLVAGDYGVESITDE